MDVAIVTGVSRGLGAETVRVLLENKICVIGLSRTNNEDLDHAARTNDTPFIHYECDLSNLEAIEETFNQITKDLEEINTDNLYLINNAGVVDPIDHSMQVDNATLKNHVMINTVAPMALMNMSLKWATDHNAMFTGVTITSGAADRSVYGWSAYSSTKASINRYTETVALEQAELGTDHKVFAFSPGTMDTEMQSEIRQTSTSAFIDRDQFRSLKHNDMLHAPEDVARVLVNILVDRNSIANGKIYSVRDYL